MLDDIRKFINERVQPVDFLTLLKEDDEPAPADDAGGGDDAGFDDAGGGDDAGFDDAGGFDDSGDMGGGGLDGGPGGPDGGPGGGDSGEDLGDDTEDKGGDKFADREDDPDFKNGMPTDGSAAETGPSGNTTYQVEDVLRNLNGIVDSGDIDLAEIEPSKLILELIANGKKLKEEDFEEIHQYESFSEIVKKCLEGVDDRTRDYFNLKIKEAILEIQKQKKIDASKAKGDVDQLRNIADEF